MNTPTATTSPVAGRRSAAQSSLGDRASLAWENMAPRERRAVSLAAWVLGLALLWWVLLGPALATLKRAPEQHARLDAQIAQMQRLAASAEQLRGQNSAPTPSRRAAESSLQQATAALGTTAQLSVQGDRAMLTLQGTAPQALAVWLGQVRVNARLAPVSAQLEHRANASGWFGQITVAGPGLGQTAP